MVKTWKMLRDRLDSFQSSVVSRLIMLKLLAKWWFGDEEEGEWMWALFEVEFEDMYMVLMEFLHVTSEWRPSVLCCCCWSCCCWRCCKELICADEPVLLLEDLPGFNDCFSLRWCWLRGTKVWSLGRVVRAVLPDKISEEELMGIGREIGGRGAWLTFFPLCPDDRFIVNPVWWCCCSWWLWWWFRSELWLLLMLFNCCLFLEEATLSDDSGNREVNIFAVLLLSCLIPRQRTALSFLMESEHLPDPFKESVGVVGSSSDVPSPASVTAFSSKELPVDLSEIPSSSPFSYHSLSYPVIQIGFDPSSAWMFVLGTCVRCVWLTPVPGLTLG